VERYSPLADSPVRLAGNDQAGYDKVLIAFVGSWETLEQVISISFALRKTGKKTRDANAYPTQWAQLTRSWPSLQTHLQSTAYFFAAAVWNEDETGSERYRDLLLRWLNPFYSFLGHDYEFRNRFLLTPDLMALTWSDVEPFAAALATVLPEERTTPPAVFGLVMRGEHEDVITLCAAISLSWFAREQGATDIGARAGVKILNREVLDEGSDLTASISQPRTVFRSVFDLLLRHTLNPRFGKAKYGETLDGLVQLLAGVASRRMVPGRVYTGWGLEGVESLRPYLLAILAANLPTQADDGVLRAIAEMQAPGGPLSDDDAVRHFIQTFEVLLNTLGATVNEPFARIVRAFNPALNPEECRLALHDLLTSIVTTLQSKQLVRLQNAPLDEAKIQNTRERITKELLAHGPDIHCFRGVVLERGAPSAPIQESRFGVVDRGAFSEPPMSAIEFDEYARIIADESGHRLASDVWRDFFGRAKETIAVATSNGLINFWRAVIANAPRVGPEPTILVPYDDFGEQVAQASHGMTGSGLDAFQVIRVEHFRGGGGIAYMGTIEGVHVFSAEVKPGTATLFSGRSLLGITYGVVHGDEDLADLEFEETENPAESWIRLRFAQTTTWAGTPTLDFHYPVQKEDPT
jgi:hypothetical protein